MATTLCLSRLQQKCAWRWLSCTGHYGRSEQKLSGYTKGFLLHSHNSDLNDHVGDIPEGEPRLLREAVLLDTVEQPLRLAQRVIREAVSFDEYHLAFGRLLGIFETPKA